MGKNRIIELRRLLGLSQAELAEKIGVSQTSVSDWERGRCFVSKRSAADICRAFNVSPEWLETGRGEMFQSGEEARKEEGAPELPEPFTYAKSRGLPDSVAVFIDSLFSCSPDELKAWGEFLPYLFPLFESFASDSTDGGGILSDRFGARYRKRLDALRKRRAQRDEGEASETEEGDSSAPEA